MMIQLSEEGLVSQDLLIIYSSFTHHLLVDPYSPYWFPGRVTPPATTSGGLFFVARHTTLPGDGGSGPALQVRGVQV